MLGRRQFLVAGGAAVGAAALGATSACSPAGGPVPGVFGLGVASACTPRPRGPVDPPSWPNARHHHGRLGTGRHSLVRPRRRLRHRPGQRRARRMRQGAGRRPGPRPLLLVPLPLRRDDLDGRRARTRPPPDPHRRRCDWRSPRCQSYASGFYGACATSPPRTSARCCSSATQHLRVVPDPAATPSATSTSRTPTPSSATASALPPVPQRPPTCRPPHAAHPDRPDVGRPRGGQRPRPGVPGRVP